MRRLLPLLALMLGLLCSPAFSQEICPNCPPNDSGITLSVQDVVPLEELGFTFGEENWAESACRALLGNGCGSGSLCGIADGKSYVLTNAHVAGTKVGVNVKLRFMHGDETVEYTGHVVMAAYSSRYQTDWALVVVDEKIPAKPRPLSKKKPSVSSKYVTHGSPRCVWPQATQYLRDHQIDPNNPWWTWLPNSIGGQSGSGVWDADSGVQFGLLTWSANGRGAGQQTAEIYRQAKQQTNVGENLPEGFKPVTAAAGVVCEDGFFAETGITDLPIWADEKPPAVEPEPDPIPPSMEEDEKRLIQKIREINQARRAKREKAVDWIALIQLILKLLELFGVNTSVDNPDFAFDVRVIPTRAVSAAWQLAA